MSSVSSPFPFLGLPNEIWEQITNKMDFPTLVNFSQTCKWAKEFVDTPSTTRLWVKQIGLKMDNSQEAAYPLEEIYGISRIVQIYRKVFSHRNVSDKNFSDIQNEIRSIDILNLDRTDLTALDYELLRASGCRSAIPARKILTC